ncbi:MAG: hypothetical protein WD042_04645 [Phycisphaeraceae bacterium]
MPWRARLIVYAILVAAALAAIAIIDRHAMTTMKRMQHEQASTQ